MYVCGTYVQKSIQHDYYATEMHTLGLCILNMDFSQLIKAEV